MPVGHFVVHPEPHPVVIRARTPVLVMGDMALSAAPCRRADDHPGHRHYRHQRQSTTTALTAHLLQAQGWMSMGGNIGRPVLDLGLPQDNTVYVLSCPPTSRSGTRVQGGWRFC